MLPREVLFISLRGVLMLKERSHLRCHCQIPESHQLSGNDKAECENPTGVLNRIEELANIIRGRFRRD